MMDDLSLIPGYRRNCMRASTCNVDGNLEQMGSLLIGYSKSKRRLRPPTGPAAAPVSLIPNAIVVPGFGVLEEACCRLKQEN